jgi:phage-related protein
MLSIPIISSFDGSGIDKAKREFKQLETVGQKAQFALKKAVVPAAAALAGLGGFLVTAAKGAEDARIANEKLGSVLDTMGFGAATDRVSAYAESLEKTVAVDADVIKATQTKLATFGELTKSVGKADGAFDRATKAALDLAAAGFGTAEGNAVQLGKALQNPIKGIAALAKSGVTFTDSEKEKIKALTESGKLLEAQEMILKAVEGQVGGTAEASASSFDKMKFSLAGVSDTFGEMLLPVIDAVAPKLAAFSEWAQKNPGLMKIAVITIGALTAAVVALNIAMSLNPVSLIVIGIGLLIAGLAVAYTKFEGFRKIVNLVFDGIKFGFEILMAYFKTLLGVYKGIFNGFASIWNNTIGKIQIKIPDIKGLPGRGKTFGVPNIPMLAEGGIVTSATLAVVGEKGPEAVIPLDRAGEFGMGGGGNNVTIHVNGGDPQSVVDALRTYMFRNGSVPIRVSG